MDSPQANILGPESSPNPAPSGQQLPVTNESKAPHENGASSGRNGRDATPVESANDAYTAVVNDEDVNSAGVKRKRSEFEGADLGHGHTDDETSGEEEKRKKAKIKEVVLQAFEHSLLETLDKPTSPLVAANERNPKDNAMEVVGQTKCLTTLPATSNETGQVYQETPSLNQRPALYIGSQRPTEEAQLSRRGESFSENIRTPRGSVQTFPNPTSPAVQSPNSATREHSPQVPSQPVQQPIDHVQPSSQPPSRPSSRPPSQPASQAPQSTLRTGSQVPSPTVVSSNAPQSAPSTSQSGVFLPPYRVYPFAPPMSISPSTTMVQMPIRSHIAHPYVPSNAGQAQQPNSHPYIPQRKNSREVVCTNAPPQHMMSYQPPPNAQVPGQGMVMNPQRRQSAPPSSFPQQPPQYQHQAKQTSQRRSTIISHPSVFQAMVEQMSPATSPTSQTPPGPPPRHTMIPLTKSASLTAVTGGQGVDPSSVSLPAPAQQPPFPSQETPVGKAAQHQTQGRSDTSMSRQPSRAIESAADKLMKFFVGAAVEERRTAQSNENLVALLRQKEAELEQERTARNAEKATFKELGQKVLRFMQKETQWKEWQAEKARYMGQLDTAGAEKVQAVNQLLEGFRLEQAKQSIKWEEEKARYLDQIRLAEADRRLALKIVEELRAKESEADGQRAAWNKERKAWEVEKARNVKVMGLANEQIVKLSDEVKKSEKEREAWKKGYNDGVNELQQRLKQKTEADEEISKLKVKYDAERAEWEKKSADWAKEHEQHLTAKTQLEEEITKLKDDLEAFRTTHKEEQEQWEKERGVWETKKAFMFRQRDIFKETIAADRLEFENAKTLWAYDRKASEGKLADQLEQYNTAMREVNEFRQSKTELETLLAQERKVWEEEKARGAQELRVAKGEIVKCHKKAQDMEAERIKWEKDRDLWESENVRMAKMVAEAMDELLKVDDGLPAFWTQLLETLEEQQTEEEPGQAQNCLDGTSRVTSSLLAQVQLLAISLRKVKEGALAKANESKAEIAKLQRKAAKLEEARAKDREQWEQERVRSAEQASVAKKLLRKAEKDKSKQHTPPETQASSSSASKAADSSKTPEEEICELKQTAKAKREPNKSLTAKNTKSAEKAQRSSSNSAAASSSSSVDKAKKLTAKVKKSEEDVRKVKAKKEQQAHIADMEKMLAAYPPSQAKGSAPSVSQHIYLSDSDSIEIISRPGTPLRSSKAGKNRKSNK